MNPKEEIKPFLAALESRINQLSFGEKPKELYEPIRYTMAMGGKRMRPLLSLLSYQLFKPNWQSILDQSIAIEVFHNFTLLHDDIMDNAPLRRGQATVHARWNENVAILSGDVMLVRAYDLLLGTPDFRLAKLIRRFNQTAAEVCEGQQLDMNFESQSTISKEQYIEMIKLKTAVLLGFSLWMGALLAGADESECEKLYEAGVDLGIGFQLMDDVLDVYADKEKFGKQVGGDIISNKKTFLLLSALEKVEGEDKNRLNEWLEAISFDPHQKVKEVTAIYNRLGIKELCQAEMNNYYQKAFELLNQLKPANPEGLELLESLMHGLINREK